MSLTWPVHFSDVRLINEISSKNPVLWVFLVLELIASNDFRRNWKEPNEGRNTENYHNWLRMQNWHENEKNKLLYVL